ncbi:hypothetical protein HZ326_26242 [Fusarium oxysporum f. sp. albedinis]|nr:hypothetical protein HZ326_26242 [Fusarium oxysporum f. sp. albedinis]
MGIQSRSRGPRLTITDAISSQKPHPLAFIFGATTRIYRRQLEPSSSFTSCWSLGHHSQCYQPPANIWNPVSFLCPYPCSLILGLQR